MRVLSLNGRRFSTVLSWASVVVAGLCLSASTAWAQSGASIVRVEEDWELVIALPDEDGDSPQVTIAMSPAGDDEGDYCSFELNHQSQPSFYSGGLHLHAWDGEFLLGSAHSQSGVTLHRVNESISWTQSMTLSDGHLVYAVSQGNSETWGGFGGDSFQVSVNCGLSNLNGYDPAASVRNSGVGYGANRVHSLVLKTVRLVTASGDTVEVSLNQSVLQQVD